MCIDDAEVNKTRKDSSDQLYRKCTSEQYIFTSLISLEKFGKFSGDTI